MTRQCNDRPSSGRWLIMVRSGAMMFALAASSSIAADVTSSQLLGCWSDERKVVHYQNGTTSESHSPCFTRFGEHRYAIVCPDPAGVHADTRSEGTYEVMGDGIFATTLTRHSRYPALVGKRSTIHYHIAGDRLIVTAYPPKMQGMWQIVSVESTSERMWDESSSSSCPALSE